MSKTVSLAAFGFLAVIGLMLSGCQSTTHSKEEQIRKYSRMSTLYKMMMVDDIDKMLLMDRPSRLSEWHMVTE